MMSRKNLELVNTVKEMIADAIKKCNTITNLSHLIIEMNDKLPDEMEVPFHQVLESLVVKTERDDDTPDFPNVITEFFIDEELLLWHTKNHIFAGEFASTDLILHTEFEIERFHLPLELENEVRFWGEEEWEEFENSHPELWWKEREGMGLDLRAIADNLKE